MADFSPRSLRVGHLLVGIGLFIVAAVIGLGWIEGRFVSDSDRDRSERGYRYLLARVNDKIAGVEDELEIVERISRQLNLKLARHEAEGELLEAASALKGEIARLGSLVSKLEEEWQIVVEERISYRDTVRDRLWRSMIGQRLEEENLLRKLPHQDMVISGVDSAGLMVRHRSGAARVSVSELTPAFREKLDLHRDEGAGALRKILARNSRASKDDEVKVAPVTPSPSGLGKLESLVKIRSRILNLEALIRKTDREAAVAREMDLRSRTRSAPGSLETWSDRARRLDGQVLKYRNQLVELQLALGKLGE